MKGGRHPPPFITAGVQDYSLANLRQRKSQYQDTD